VICDAILIREHEFASAVFGPALQQLIVGYVVRTPAVVKAKEAEHE